VIRAASVPQSWMLSGCGRSSFRGQDISNHHELEHAWMNEWEKLDIEKNINAFRLKQKHRVAQVIVKQGGNNFHE